LGTISTGEHILPRNRLCIACEIRVRLVPTDIGRLKSPQMRVMNRLVIDKGKINRGAARVAAQ
jgi:hypothetical protein